MWCPNCCSIGEFVRSPIADTMPKTPKLPGSVAVVWSNSGDLAVAEEFRIVAEHMGWVAEHMGWVAEHMGWAAEQMGWVAERFGVGGQVRNYLSLSLRLPNYDL